VLTNSTHLLKVGVLNQCDCCISINLLNFS
jgi:hypothetical protein